MPKYLLVLVLFILLLLGSLGGYYIYLLRNGTSPALSGLTSQKVPYQALPTNTEIVNTAKEYQDKAEAETDNSSKIAIAPEFEYTVGSYDQDKIVLSTEDGGTMLVKDVTVYVLDGYPPEKAKAVSRSTLAIGQKVRLQFIPGDTFWIYIVTH